MEELFFLTEKIVSSLKAALLHNREKIGVFNFDNAVISNSNFELKYSSKEKEISVQYRSHHLDNTSRILVIIKSESNEICLNDLFKGLNEEDPFEVYPKLLHDPEGLGKVLASKISEEILRYLSQMSEY